VRILISNKFYYNRGGGDIYTLELEKLLRKNGHEVAAFSMQHPLNIPSVYSGYFPTEVDVNRKDFNNLFKFVNRPFGSPEVRKKFTALLKSFKPDILHLNNIHSQLSPVLAVIAKRHNIPVVWTLHDHKLLCPRYDCTRDHKPCELCFTAKFNVVRFKCMKNSVMASIVAYAEALTWNRKVLGNSTDVFICPSSFLRENMIKGGFASDKLRVISNFILEEKLSFVPTERQNYYCYVGRLSAEKGVSSLLEAASEMPQYELKVIGTGPLEDELKARYTGSNIKFEGYKKWPELKEILGNSKFMVMPSVCYENNPLSVIESLCLGTPVVGARIGGIPELIHEGVNGYSYISGNVEDLKAKIRLMFDNAAIFNYREISKEAVKNYNSENYYQEILMIYKSILNAKE